MMEQMVCYPDDLEEVLDFSRVRKALYDLTWCEDGKTTLSEQPFFTRAKPLEEELGCVAEMKALIESGSSLSRMPFIRMEDILKTLKTDGRLLDEEQFVRLHRFIKGGHDVLKFLNKKAHKTAYPSLAHACEGMVVETVWYKAIEKTIDIDEGLVHSNASPGLMKIRNQIKKLKRRKDKIFDGILNELSQNDMLADQRESWREGRRVLAVKAEKKREVRGLTLDISGNGTIAFIEPAEVLPIETELSEQDVRERKEIERILAVLTASMALNYDTFKALLTLIARLDAWQAKAQLAFKWECHQPEISADIVELRQARHPILETHLKSLGKTIVPLDVKLHPGGRLLVISGPNAGGKSVAMKTVGLLQLMAQFGLQLPAGEGSSIVLFQSSFVDIGDDQSIEDDLSTYSSHLVKMAAFCKQVNSQSLILIDEMGSGTDPAFGGPIAEAILEKLANAGAYGVITTHYSNLKEFAAGKQGLENGAMSFDTKALLPSFGLHIGQAGASYALEVAERSGLPDSVLLAAREKLGNPKQVMDKTLSVMQSEKQFLKGIRKESQKRSAYLGQLVDEYEDLKKSLEKNKKKLVRQYEEKLLEDYNEANRQLETLIREAREKKQKVEKAKAGRKNLDEKRRKLADKIHLTDIPVTQENKSPIVVGSRVRLEESPRIGVVTEIRKKEASVRFDRLTTKVPLKKLIHCVDEGVRKTQKEKPASKGPDLKAKSCFDLELDVRGKYKDELLTTLEQFLDKAVMFGIDRLRIIHGKGRGVLRQTVHQYLKSYPFVSTYKLEEQEHGGDGVTLVELKD